MAAAYQAACLFPVSSSRLPVLLVRVVGCSVSRLGFCLLQAGDGRDCWEYSGWGDEARAVRLPFRDTKQIMYDAAVAS